MLNFKPDAVFKSKEKQIIVQEATCLKCHSQFIKVFRQYGTGSPIKIASNIDTYTCECPTCNNHSYDVRPENMNAGALMISKVIQDTTNNNTSSQLRCEKYTGAQKSDLWHILYTIGKYGVNPYGNIQLNVSKVAIQCAHCGYIKIIHYDELNNINNCVCNQCRALLVKKSIEYVKDVKNKIQSDINDILKASNNDANNTIQQAEAPKMVSKTSDSISHKRKILSKYTKTMQLLAAYTLDGDDIAVLCCTLCGTPKNVSSYRMNDLKAYKCAGCEQQKTDVNYLGLYKRDITNMTKNGLVCIGQDNEAGTVDLSCHYCKRVYKGRKKSDFLLGKIYCDREETCSSVDVECSNCHRSFMIKNKRVTEDNRDKIKCSYCNASMYTDCLNEITSMDQHIEIRRGLNYMSSKTKKPVILHSNVARTATPLYRGDDGLDYYNCRCLEHNQNCILNEKELEYTPHKYCNNMHNLFIDEENIRNISLNREASAAVKEENKKK